MYILEFKITIQEQNYKHQVKENMNDYINSTELLKSRKTVLISISNQNGNYLSCVNDNIDWSKKIFKWNLIPVENNKWLISYTNGFGAFSSNYYLYCSKMNKISYMYKVTSNISNSLSNLLSDSLSNSLFII